MLSAKGLGLPVYGRNVTLCPPDRLPREGETIFSRVTVRSISDYVIDQQTGCWVWTKATLRGYPASGSASRKPVRLYYARANGAIPSDHDIHHLCRNTRCLNPAHLEAVDSYAHKFEHAVSKRKLTVEQAREVRELGALVGVTYAQLAERFRCHESFIEDVLMGRTFREVFGSEPVKVVRICAGCGTEFDNRKRHARYCSTDCQMGRGR